MRLHCTPSKSTTDGNLDYYLADVLTVDVYYPFGMLMPGRKYTAGDGFRYGFNGKENDDEVKGEANQQDYGLRIYDSRIAKFLSSDPLSMAFPYYSPYQFAGNTPIQAIDLDGGEPKGYKWNNPYVASHPGSGVTPIPSEYDQLPLQGSVGDYNGIINAYAVQDITNKTYLIYEDVHGTRQWAVEYENGQWKGSVNEFKWNNAPNAADALAAMTLAPLIGVPGLVAAGAGGSYLASQMVNLAANVYPWLPTIGAAGRTTAEFLDESGSIGATGNVNKVIVAENRLRHIFRKRTGHFSRDTPEARKILEDLANEPTNLHGGDKHGNSWYAKLNEKGQQYWAEVRDGKIINGGINETPKIFNSESGFSAIEKPK